MEFCGLLLVSLFAIFCKAIIWFPTSLVGILVKLPRTRDTMKLTNSHMGLFENASTL